MIEINGVELKNRLFDWKRFFLGWLPIGVSYDPPPRTVISVPVPPDPLSSLVERMRPRVTYEIETDTDAVISGTRLETILFLNNRAVFRFEEMRPEFSFVARCANLYIDGHRMEGDSPLHNARMVAPFGFTLQYQFHATTLNGREIPVTMYNLDELISIWKIERGHA